MKRLMIASLLTISACSNQANVQPSLPTVETPAVSIPSVEFRSGTNVQGVKLSASPTEMCALPNLSPILYEGEFWGSRRRGKASIFKCTPGGNVDALGQFTDDAGCMGEVSVLYEISNVREGDRINLPTSVIMYWEPTDCKLGEVDLAVGHFAINRD